MKKRKRLKGQSRGLRLSTFKIQQRENVIMARKLRSESYSFLEMAELMGKSYGAVRKWTIDESYDVLVNHVESDV